MVCQQESVDRAWNQGPGRRQEAGTNQGSLPGSEEGSGGRIFRK